MRGRDQQQQAMFSYISPEIRLPKPHPLRPIRIMVDNALMNMAPLFRKIYIAKYIFAIVALSETKTLAELSSEYGVHPTQIIRWK